MFTDIESEAGQLRFDLSSHVITTTRSLEHICIDLIACLKSLKKIFT